MQQHPQSKNDQDNPSGKAANKKKVVPIIGAIIATACCVVGITLIGWAVAVWIPLGQRGQVFAQSALSFAVLVVVTIQAYIYFRQANALDAQIDLSRQTFELLERPSLGVEVRVIPTEDKMGHSIRVLIENTGHLPARLTTTIVSGTRVSPAGASDEEAEANIWPMEPPPGMSMSKGIIPISGTATAFAYPVMTNQQFALVQAGREDLYASVRIDYGMDGKTQPFFLEYYGRFSRHTDAFDILPTHNDAN
jgi:hypothetical protein